MWFCEFNGIFHTIHMLNYYRDSEIHVNVKLESLQICTKGGIENLKHEAIHLDFIFFTEKMLKKIDYSTYVREWNTGYVSNTMSTITFNQMPKIFTFRCIKTTDMVASLSFLCDHRFYELRCYMNKCHTILIALLLSLIIRCSFQF